MGAKVKGESMTITEYFTFVAERIKEAEEKGDEDEVKRLLLVVSKALLEIKERER